MNKTPTSIVPAVLNAYYGWFLQNEIEKIHILVYADENTPAALKANIDLAGMIRYNIGMLACRNLSISQQGISFSMRVRGEPFDIHVKCEDVFGVEIPLNERHMTVHQLNDHQCVWKRVAESRPSWYTVEVTPEPTPKPERPSLKVVK